MRIIRPTLFLVVLLQAVLTLVPARAQDDVVPPSAAVIETVLQDASRVSGRTLTPDSLQWHFVTFKTTSLDCTGGSKPAYPAMLYGYDLTVSWSGGKLDYRARALADRLFRCTANGPEPDIKIIHSAASLLPAPIVPIPADVPERGTPPLDNGPLVRHETQRFGRGTLDTAAYRPDGKVLAVGGSLGIWLLNDDLSPAAHLGGSSLKVTSLAWRPDGKQIATTAYENAVQLWDVDTGVVRTLEQLPWTGTTTDYNGSVSYSSDGLRLASAGPDRAVKIWDTTTGKLLNTVRFGGEVHAVAWNQDGKRLAVGGAIPAVTDDAHDRPLGLVYDVAAGTLLATLQPTEFDEGYTLPGAPILDMRWYPDGKRLFLISSPQNSKDPVGWNTDTGELTDYDVFLACGVVLTGIYVSPDVGHYAAALYSCESAAAGATAYATGEGTSAPEGERELLAGYGVIRTIAWSPDGIHVAVVRSTSGIALHDITKLDQTGVFSPVQRKFEVVGKVTDPDDPTASPPGMGWAMMARDEWQVIDPSSVESPSPSPDGKIVAAFDSHLKQTVLLDARTGDVLKTLDNPPDVQYGAYFYNWSGDGTRLAGHGSPESTTVWDARTGGVVLHLKGDLWCQFGAENARLVCDARPTNVPVPLVVIDAATGVQIRTLDDHFSGDLVWGPQRRSLAVINYDGHVRLWNRTFDQQLQDMPGAAVQWSPDGSRLIAIQADGTAHLYNAATGQIIAVLQGSSGPLFGTYGARNYTIAFSPDSTRFVTEEISGEMDIYDTHTGQKLLRLVGHRGPLAVLPTWSDDGSQITSRGTDGTVRVWSVN